MHGRAGTSSLDAVIQDEGRTMLTDNQQQPMQGQQHIGTTLEAREMTSGQHGETATAEVPCLRLSSPSSSDSIPPGTSGPSPDRRRTTIDRLAKKLSRQNLQLDVSGRIHQQPRPQLQTQPSPLSQIHPPHPQAPQEPPLPSYLARNPELPTFSPLVDAPPVSPSWVSLEVDPHLQQNWRPVDSRVRPWLSELSPDAPPPELPPPEDHPTEMVLDEREVPASEKLREWKGVRHRPSGRLRPGPAAQAQRTRLEELISAELRELESVPSRPEAPQPLARPITSYANVTVFAEPTAIEVDPDCAMPSADDMVEVDEAYMAGGSGNPDYALGEHTVPLRRAGTPGGVRKYTTNGVALKYRLSIDAALRCQNVVRNRPRMRRRHKSKHASTEGGVGGNGGDGQSSIMTSAAPSAVHSPTVASSADISAAPGSSFRPPPPPPPS